MNYIDLIVLTFMFYLRKHMLSEYNMHCVYIFEHQSSDKFSSFMAGLDWILTKSQWISSIPCQFTLQNSIRTAQWKIKAKMMYKTLLLAAIVCAVSRKTSYLEIFWESKRIWVWKKRLTSPRFLFQNFSTFSLSKLLHIFHLWISFAF